MARIPDLPKGFKERKVREHDNWLIVEAYKGKRGYLFIWDKISKFYSYVFQKSN